MANREAPSTSKKRSRIAPPPDKDDEAENATTFQSMLNQLQVHLDGQFGAVQTSITAMESLIGVMDLKLDTIAGDIAYLRDHMPAYPASP